MPDEVPFKGDGFSGQVGQFGVLALQFLRVAFAEESLSGSECFADGI